VSSRNTRKDKIAEITRRNLSVVFVGCYHYIVTHFCIIVNQLYSYLIDLNNKLIINVFTDIIITIVFIIGKQTHS